MKPKQIRLKSANQSTEPHGYYRLSETEFHFLLRDWGIKPSIQEAKRLRKEAEQQNPDRCSCTKPPTHQ